MRQPCRHLFKVNQSSSSYLSGSPAFTIVELLVVIVVIAILAAITIVAYSGISQRATAASMQSDMNGIATQLKMYQISNGTYPNSINDCPTPAANNICVKLSPGNSVIGYSANNASSAKTFLLIASNGSGAYRVTDKAAPVLLADATQPGITPGAIMELHGAKANGGVSQGINSPLTTTWYDTSGNGNNGTLTNFSGSPWSGVGTTIDPYKLTSDGTSNYVSGGVNPDFDFEGPFTIELWIAVDPTMATGFHGIVAKYDNWAGWDFGIYENKWAMALRGIDSAHSIQHESIGDGYADGTMRHVVMSNTNTLISPYVNGVALTPETSKLWTPNPAVGKPLTIFSRYWWTNYCKASIGVLRIYPYALSAAQVTANYNAGPDW